MNTGFFPNLIFAGVYALILLGGLVILAWIDWKTLRLPKTIVLPLAAIGLVVNLIRGGWLASLGQPVWLFGEVGVALGCLEGLLFGFSGLLAGFLLFFVLWIFSVVGGGDVKLVAAGGAWLGPSYIFGAILFSALFLMLLTLLSLTLRMLSGRLPRPGPVAPLPGRTGIRRPLTSYALAFCLGTAMILALLIIGYWHTVGKPTA